MTGKSERYLNGAVIKVLKKFSAVQTVLALILAILITVTVIAAWAPYFEQSRPVQVEMGTVKVSADVYFKTLNPDGSDNERVEADFAVVPDTQVEKNGIYNVNISNMSHAHYIQNLRIDIKIESSVYTYVRLSFVEQLTYTYQTTTGVKTELSLIDTLGIEKYTYFKYNLDNNSGWYLDKDGVRDYFYYVLPAMRTESDTGAIAPAVIPFIIKYDKAQYPPKSDNHSIQFAIFVEGVQQKGGPQNHWKITDAPWLDADSGWPQLQELL